MQAWTCVLLVSVISTTLIAGCEPTPQPDTPEPAPTQLGPRPDSEQWQAVIQLYEKGIKRSSIDADYLAVFQEAGSSRTRMDTLEVDFFDLEGENTSHLIADSGEIFDQDREGRRKVKTWGGVLLTGPEGQVVRADTLWWDERNDQLYTDGPVEVTQDGDLLNAIGFESDTKLEEMRFGEVTGRSLQGGAWVDEEGRNEGAQPDTASTNPDTASTNPDTSGVNVSGRGGSPP
ncbi:LPS export ABC transporter periplasmic protein LptC [Candidatus Zixiibacteriota bacterium]